MSRSRRNALTLAAMVIVVAVAAQVAGVATRTGSPSAQQKTLAVVPGGAVPDITSTKLAQTSTRATRGTTVRMRATARVAVRTTGKARTAQVVCGIRYSRAGDASWSLGDPYDVVTLRRGQAKTVVVERSFVAPASDRYSMTSACHVAAPAKGASVRASGTMRVARGLPAGAATPQP
jgi:hypothetical protein